MPFFVFVFWLAVLIAEGTIAASLILKRPLSIVRSHEGLLLVALGLPIAALINVLIVFLFTILSIPLLFWTMMIGHGVVIGILLIAYRRCRQNETCASHVFSSGKTMTALVIRIGCIVLLAIQFLFSFSHSVILPTFPIDSLTNWTMRSQVSFYDHAIAFDQTEARGVAKPQYPFLFHAMQITVNEGNMVWNDRSANSILFLLTLFSFAALFLLLKEEKGFDAALIGLTLITSIPLLSFHLSGGYGDITLVQFLCLSLLTYWLWRKHTDAKWLMLSALFMTASVWAKSEGLIIGLIPWFAFVAMDLRHHSKKTLLRPLSVGLILSAIFPLFLLSRGMGLTPHQSDTSLEWHPDAFQAAISGLFTSGSMGVTWFVILIGGLLLLWLVYRKDDRIDHSAVMMGWWGLFCLLVILFTYIFTPNATFLADGESYYRQLMIPAALLLLWGCCSLKSLKR